MEAVNKKAEREKIVLSCEYYKKILKKWDDAILKTEGRKPNKDDLKHAPEKIQKSYKKYYKLAAYLKKTSSSGQHGKSAEKSRGLTPRKIFDGTHPTSKDNTGETASTSKSRETRLFRQSGPGGKEKKKSVADYNRFSEKIFNVVNILSKQSLSRVHRTIKVVEEDSGQEVIRKALVPNRFTKKLDPINTVGKSADDKSVPNGLSDSSGNSSLLTDHENEEDQLLDINQSGPSTSTKFSSRLNSVGSVWQNLSPNPKSKTLKSEKLKFVDSGWLNRCGMELDKDGEENDIDIPKLGDVDKSGNGEVQDSSEVNNKTEGLFSHGFQKLLLSASCEIKTSEPESLSINGFVGANYSHSSQEIEQRPIPFESESADSGIGLYASAFTTISQDIQDVFEFDAVPPSSTNVFVEENAMFYSDNACPTPDAVLQTIDTNAIADLFTSNPFSSSSSSLSLDAESSSRKRSAMMAFSPSPKKTKPPRKFFKSDRSHVKVARYTVNSYKPLTPIKKKPIQPLATVASKSANTTVTTIIGLSTPTTRNEQNNSTENQLPIKVVSDSETSGITSPPLPIKPIAKKGKARAKPLMSDEKKTVKKPRVNKSKLARNSTKKEAADSIKDTSIHPSTSFNQNITSEYYNDVAPTSAPTGRRGTRRPRLTNKEALQRKVNLGGLNDNFVRIDITKKVFVRGRKKISGAKVKRNDWKLKKASASKEDKIKAMTCRKCGEAGHFAKFCMKDTLQKEDPEEVDDSPFPTLEEVARMAKGRNSGLSQKRVNVFGSGQENHEKDGNNTSQTEAQQNMTQTDLNDEETDSQVNVSTAVDDNSTVTGQIKPVPPYFGYETGSTLCSQEEEETILNDALKKFGYNEFRGGQLEAISRVLKGLSTLVILSTGSGKSLCYQLPAYLYALKNPGALTICVSPLVSLMEDQVVGIPSFLEAACLHSNMSSVQKEKVMDRIRSKKLHILLVSPEAVCGGLFGLLRGVSDLPRISFACIDEVHCVSQWSHNFRPCYLQLSKILREKLNINTILGLTATATESTAIGVCEHLQVDPSTTIRGEIVPCNLNLSVSRDSYREEGLLVLLRGERFKECESIIIYCTRREECQRIACLIRTNMQDIPSFNGVTKTNLRQRVSNNCEAYHAGMTAGRRRLVQQQFMSGKIRIVVATVAFGMGIDKSDIRTVIHYNMPKTFESYVQEIGRAGRDGKPAHCHLFLDNVKGRDLSELRRHVYTNSVDRPTLRKLIRRVFQSCRCKRIAELSAAESQDSQSDIQQVKRCPGHEVSFSINDTVTELDLAQENITTLLCYLELDKSKRWIEMLSHTYETCKIHSYGGAKLLKSSALKCPPLAAAIALKKEKQRKFKDTDTYLEFNVIEVAATLGWNSGIVKRELKNLEWSATNFDDKGNSKRYRKSGILVEFCDLAFHLNAPGDLTDEEADIVLNYLHKHNVDHEQSQLYQLTRVYQALLSISCPNVDSASDTFNEDKSEMLKKFIYDYFTQKSLGVPPDWKNDISQDEGKRDDIIRDVGNLISNHRDIQFTGRSIAKIFQGISSPCFPSDVWGRNRAYWRKHLEVDFNFLCQIAGQEILRH